MKKKQKDTKEFFRLLRYMFFHDVCEGQLYRILDPTIYQEKPALLGAVVNDVSDVELIRLKPGVICMIVKCEDITKPVEVDFCEFVKAILCSPLAPKRAKEALKTISRLTDQRRYRIMLLCGEKLVRLEVDAGNFFEHVIVAKK